MGRYAFALIVLVMPQPTAAQPSPGKAAALSVLLPGLGHRYANEGSWRGTASMLVLAEAGFWLGVLGSEWQRGQTVQSYRTYAATYAGAQLQGKDRRFFVTLGNYLSSDAYREDRLRQRRWDQVGYVNDPAFRWQWRSEDEMATYRRLRSAADSWAQRRTVFIATLVANRILAVLSALRSARRHRSALAGVSVSLVGRVPVMNIAMQL